MFSSQAIGDKNQIKGSDARRFVIKLAKFIHALHVASKVSDDVVKLTTSLIEIIHIVQDIKVQK